MSSQRLFVAIPVPEALHAEIAAAVRQLDQPGLRPVSTDNLHITLRFLGDVFTSDVPALTAALERELHGLPRFTCHLGPIAPGISKRRPRLFASLIGDPTGHLAEVAAAVERAVVATGLGPADRPFHGHVTVARMRRGARITRPETIDLNGVIEVEHVCLIASELRPEGAHYTELARMGLS